MIIEIAAIIVTILLTALMCSGNFGVGSILTMVLDFPSLISIVILAFPILLRNGMWKDFVRGFKLLSKKYKCSLADLKRTLDAVELLQKQILYAGIILTVFPTIFVLGQLSTPEIVGANIAVALIVILYAAIFEMLLLPIHIEVKRRIIDHMEAE